MDSELTMVVDSKFNSILKEIQQSKLNFVISLTPFSANITLKKSTQVDKNGAHIPPAPPSFLLTDMAQMGLHEVDSNYNQNVFFKIQCPSKSVRNLKWFLCTTKPQPISKLSFRPQPKSKLCFRPLSKSPALVHTTEIMTMCIEEN